MANRKDSYISFTVSHISFVDKIPPPSKRQKETVYLDVSIRAAERDHAIGKYMNQWNRLESATISLLHAILGGEYETAHTIFANSAGINSIRDLIMGLGRRKFSPPEQKNWNKINDGLGKLARSRNQIIHGVWEPTFYIHGDDKTSKQPVVNDIEWRRIYSPTDPAIRQKMLSPEQDKIKDTFILSLDDIHDKAAIVSHCADRIHILGNLMRDRISPLEQPRESSAPPFYRIRLVATAPEPKTKTPKPLPRSSPA